MKFGDQITPDKFVKVYQTGNSGGRGHISGTKRDIPTYTVKSTSGRELGELIHRKNQYVFVPLVTNGVAQPLDFYTLHAIAHYAEDIRNRKVKSTGVQNPTALTAYHGGETFVDTRTSRPPSTRRHKVT